MHASLGKCQQLIADKKTSLFTTKANIINNFI
jgi:hypothetical protein